VIRGSGRTSANGSGSLTWVITGNTVPGHATFAWLLCRHGQALRELFSAMLGLCVRAGMFGPAVVAVDGTNISGNAHGDRCLN
jgi:hypothetical protein